MHHARSGNAHVDNFFSLAYAVERPRHKGVVLHRVAEYHELCAAEPVRLLGTFRRALDDAPHERHGVEIDARLGRADVDRRAHPVRYRERFGNALYKGAFVTRHALLHERGIAAEEVHADVFRRLVQLFCEHGFFPRKIRGKEGGGRDGNALVHDGNAVFLFERGAHVHDIFRIRTDAVVAGRRRLFRALADTGNERNAHGDRSDVEVFFFHHVDGFENFFIA